MMPHFIMLLLTRVYASRFIARGGEPMYPQSAEGTLLRIAAISKPAMVLLLR